jgi:hypothetical protein
MSSQPPSDTRPLKSPEPYGIDANGNYVFFGFSFEGDGRCILSANYLQLGNAIVYLQGIAREAEQRRLKADSTAGDREARQRSSNPVRIVDIVPDLTGDTAMMACTTLTGTRIEAQLPLDLLEGLHKNLPQTIAEMKARRQASQAQH